MNQCFEFNSGYEEISDLPKMMTIICYLMTCYSIKPCEHLALHINTHLKILLNSPAAEDLGDWSSSFQQLHCKWRHIADSHAGKPVVSDSDVQESLVH